MPRKRPPARKARDTFFAKVGGTRGKRCDHTLPLFPLWLILDADGTLAADLKPLLERTQA